MLEDQGIVGGRIMPMKRTSTITEYCFVAGLDIRMG